MPNIRHLLLLLWIPSQNYAQCDLELLNFDPVAGEITVAFNNTESCGGSAGPTGIAEIQFGFQALDSNCSALNQGWDFPWGLSIPGDNNHPGWIYSATTTTQPSNWTNLDVWADYDVDPPYYTGDTITFPLDDFYQAGGTSLFSNLLNAFDFWLDQGLGIQAVIWQISYGPTVYAADGGWAEVGANGDGTSYGGGLYEDENWQDNWIIMCPDDVPEVIYVYDTVYVELPPDTIIEYVYDTTYIDLPPDTIYVLQVDTVVEYDTIPVPINWYFYDTTYIYVTDTLYLTELDTVYLTQYDTSYVTLIDTLYLIDYQVDTVYTYEYDTIEIDCENGAPCVDVITGCDLYIPNSFTPDNDGINDVWGAETDPDCWGMWNLRVFNRIGDVIWQSNYPGDVWLGGYEYYVPSDVYVYRLECSTGSDAYIINGHVTVVR